MRPLALRGLAPVVILLLGVRILPAAEPLELSAEKVRGAIDRGVALVESLEKPDGSWPEMTRVKNEPGGVDALATLALLNAGVSADDDHIKRALANIRKRKPEMVYVTSLQTMVLCMAEPKRDLLLIERNARWLEQAQIKDSGRRGAWGYDLSHAGGDNSNTQFALLGLHEAERAGIEIKPQVWKLSLDYWLRQQMPDGSWNYHEGTPGTGSMTCAGIASVIITSGKVTSADAQVEDDRLICCGKQLNTEPIERVDRALEWLGRNFSVERNPNSPHLWHLYYLYGLERVGRMSARRFIGKEDWYRRGTEYLLGKQDLTGAWVAGIGEDDPAVGTSLALLFLSKGRRPVLMAKIKHGPENDWNHHRSDVANLTSYIETQWKRDLNWQVIDLDRSTADDLIQSPVLFLNGSAIPSISDEQARTLRDYIDRGGFILAEACCPNSHGFDLGFRAAMKKVFPEAEYGLKLLPPSHPVWNAEKVIAPEMQRKLLGIDYGCRTSVIYCPPPAAGEPSGNLSCYWELAAGRTPIVDKKISQEFQSALDIGQNILAYATNRELPYRDQAFAATDGNQPKDEFVRGKIYIAKLQHSGGCDAAPGALPNLLRDLGSELQVRVDPKQRLIAITNPQLFNYPLVFMHGRHQFRFTPKEREVLKQYLTKSDGTLFVDAICASRDFADSFREEMKAIFPDQLKPIPANHRMFSKDFGGFDVSSVSRREPDVRGDGVRDARLHTGPPELEGVKLGDRYAVIFSPYDLSCALEKHDSPECAGYTRKDAEKISLNVLLYSLHQ